MTVYVDDMNAPFRGMIMCHMIADTEGELHAMADAVGVARRWYQGDHYDVALTMKARALARGAVAITWHQAGVMTMNRRAGRPLGTPDEAQATIDARYRARGVEPPARPVQQLKLI